MIAVAPSPATVSVADERRPSTTGRRLSSKPETRPVTVPSKLPRSSIGLALPDYEK